MLDHLDTINPNLIPPNPDFNSAGEGLFKSLNQTILSLQGQKPELIIGLNGSSANLANQSFSNLFSVSEAPFNIAWNRYQVAVARLLTPGDRSPQLLFSGARRIPWKMLP